MNWIEVLIATGKALVALALLAFILLILLGTTKLPRE